MDPDEIDVPTAAEQIMRLIDRVEEMLASIRAEAARLLQEESGRDRPDPDADPPAA